MEEVEEVEDVSRATDLHLVWINSLVKSWSHAGAAEMGIKLAFKLSHARSENHRVLKSLNSPSCPRPPLLVFVIERRSSALAFSWNAHPALLSLGVYSAPLRRD